MKLLVSPMDVIEAKAAVEGGADIIDIKNPSEGSLGANFPWVINEVKEAIPEGLEVSATLGDIDNRPGFASLAAYGLATLNVDYVKAGLLMGRKKEAEKLTTSIVRAVERSDIKVVLAGYADYKNIYSVHPLEIPDVARISGAQGVMVDTYAKNGTTLFEHMAPEELQGFVDSGKECGLTVALAGSLQADHMPTLKELSPDIIGVRGAVCRDNDRVSGKIEKEKVKEFKTRLKS
jgi:uncharacterized protein (UPF0264 family)